MHVNDKIGAKKIFLLVSLKAFRGTKIGTAKMKHSNHF